MNDNLHLYKERFESELTNFFSQNGPKYLYDPIKYFMLSGGKRLRPSIVLFLGDFLKNNPNDMMNAALGVEFLHCFSLVHDDIMDEDDLRHNQETIHKKWDNASAVLSGDGLGALGPIYISKIEKNTLEILRKYNRVILEICEGQAYDMQFENQNIDSDDYILMSSKKTGVLFQLCFEIPVINNGENSELLELFSLIGLNLGIIFQIQDDVLEVDNLESDIGKSIFSDIKRNKKTILTSLAFEHLGENWLDFQNNISQHNHSLKRTMLIQYLKDNKVDVLAREKVDFYKHKVFDNVKKLPKIFQEPINDTISLIIRRKK